LSAGRQKPRRIWLRFAATATRSIFDRNDDFWADPVEKEIYWATYWSERQKA
jgi:hypothetical protein